MRVDDATTFELPGAVRRRTGRPLAYVAVLAGAEPRIVALERGREITIGRSTSSDVAVEDRAVSRLQCTLRWDGGETLRLEDHGSRNGTFLDGQRVEGVATVVNGSEIEVGPLRVVVSVRAETDAGPSLPAHPGLAPDDGDDIVAKDGRMLRALALAGKAARSGVTVLLVGEVGTGKGVLARRIHAEGARAAGPFVAVDCGAVPPDAQEARLFGVHGASAPGALAQAEGGTLFLDDVAALGAEAQVRLLGLLRDASAVPVGGTEARPVDVRLVVAADRDLREPVEEGAFREDLYYRLDVLRIDVPPLRERLADVVPLADRFLRELAGAGRYAFAPDALEALEAHTWPGNVRELRNAVERALAVADGPLLRGADLGLRRDSTAPRTVDASQRELRDHVDDAERDAIVAALAAENGNQTRAAARLGIARRTLIYKMERYGLKPPPRAR